MLQSSLHPCHQLAHENIFQPTCSAARVDTKLADMGEGVAAVGHRGWADGEGMQHGSVVGGR